jgi:multiple sugar transport system ATP-binding protein
MELAVLHHEWHSTTIYVTHDQIEAMTLADRIVVMNEGRIQQIGSPNEIYNFPANIFTAAFVGMPPINLIKGQVEGETFTGFNSNKEPLFHCRVPREIVQRAGNYRQGGIVMGVRPENIRLSSGAEQKSEDQCLLNAPVETLELLGAEYNAGLNPGGRILTCRIPARKAILHGQNLEVIFNIQNAHFFDEESGLRIRGEHE